MNKAKPSATASAKNYSKVAGLAKKEINIKKLSNSNWTEAQKSDRSMYRSRQVVQFNQNCKGIKRGSIYTVNKNHEGKVILVNDVGSTIALPDKTEKCLAVYEPSEINIAKGDAVRITKNGFGINDKRIDNGTSLTVAAIDKNGNVILENKKAKRGMKWRKILAISHGTIALCPMLRRAKQWTKFLFPSPFPRLGDR